MGRTLVGLDRCFIKVATEPAELRHRVSQGGSAALTEAKLQTKCAPGQSHSNKLQKTS
jgi:hypothetical protein